MHKKAYHFPLNLKAELDNLKVGHNQGQFEAKSSMEVIPRVMDGIFPKS